MLYRFVFGYSPGYSRYSSLPSRSPNRQVMFRSQFPEFRSSFLSLLVTGAIAASPALAQSTARISVGIGGAELRSGAVWAELSGNGRYAAFVSDDPNIVPGDTNGTADVFVRDLATGVVRRASTTAAGVEPNNACFAPKLSDDGRYVAFSSWASNLAASDANGIDTDVFVKDMQTGALDHVSINNQGAGGNGISAYHDLSGDGRFVTFYSYSTNFVANDNNNQPDTFLFDRVSRRIQCLSVDPATGQTASGGQAAISFDGRIVAFETVPQVVGRTGISSTVAVFDRRSGTMTPANLDAQGQILWADSPLVSADGSSVVFHSRFSFDAADTDASEDAFLYDVTSRRIELVTPPPSSAPANADSCYATSLSASGRHVSFVTRAAYDAQDTNGVEDAFVYDRLLGTVERLSVGDNGQTGDDRSTVSILSGNGARTVFLSLATNLVSNDTNNAPDVFFRERCVAASTRLYGQGLAGAGGVVPGIAMLNPPQIGTTTVLAIANPSGSATAGLLLAGPSPASVQTPLLGTLLVQPSVVGALAVPVPALTLALPIPSDFDLCGTSVYLQAVLIDAAAPRGVSFTRGLEAVIGD